MLKLPDEFESKIFKCHWNEEIDVSFNSCKKVSINNSSDGESDEIKQCIEANGMKSTPLRSFI